MSEENNYDGVLEAVRLGSDGQLQMARVFERRGATWSDRVLLTRAQFIQRLKSRKRFRVGQRVEFMGGTFEVGRPVWLEEKDGLPAIVSRRTLFTPASAGIPAGQDCLDNVPLF